VSKKAAALPVKAASMAKKAASSPVRDAMHAGQSGIDGGQSGNDGEKNDIHAACSNSVGVLQDRLSAAVTKTSLSALL